MSMIETPNIHAQFLNKVLVKRQHFIHLWKEILNV